MPRVFPTAKQPYSQTPRTAPRQSSTDDSRFAVRCGHHITVLARARCGPVVAATIAVSASQRTSQEPRQLQRAKPGDATRCKAMRCEPMRGPFVHPPSTCCVCVRRQNSGNLARHELPVHNRHAAQRRTLQQRRWATELQQGGPLHISQSSSSSLSTADHRSTGPRVHGSTAHLHRPAPHLVATTAKRRAARIGHCGAARRRALLTSLCVTRGR